MTDSTSGRKSFPAYVNDSDEITVANAGDLVPVIRNGTAGKKAKIVNLLAQAAPPDADLALPVEDDDYVTVTRPDDGARKLLLKTFHIKRYRYSISSLVSVAQDGVTDDTQAIMDAINLGLPLDGEGATYGAASIVNQADNTDIANFIFRHVDFTQNESRIFYSEDTDRLRIQDCKFWMDGDGTAGVISGGGALGLYIVGGKDHRIKDCEFTGDGKYTAWGLFAVEHFEVENLWSHDILYNDTAILDDTVQGGLLSNCIAGRMRGCKSERLLGNPTTINGTLLTTGHYYGTNRATAPLIAAVPSARSIQLASDASAVDDYYNGMVLYFVDGPGSPSARLIDDYTGATKTCTFLDALNYFSSLPVAGQTKVLIRSNRYTRGFAYGGARDTLVEHCYSSFNDQGFDITGTGANDTDGHPGMALHACMTTDIGTWGYKWANVQQKSSAHDCIANRTGNAAFVVAGATTENISIHNPVARNVGASSIWNLSGIAAIRVLNSGSGYPKGVNIFNPDLEVVSGVAYGILSEASPFDAAKPNVIHGRGKIKGAATADVAGLFYTAYPLAFTPVFHVDTPPTGLTYDTQTGIKQVIDGRLFFDFRIEISSIGSGGSGVVWVTLGDCPVCSALLDTPTADLVAVGINLTDGYTQFGGLGVTGTNVINLVAYGDNQSNTLLITYAMLSATPTIRCSGSYPIDMH